MGGSDMLIKCPSHFSAGVCFNERLKKKKQQQLQKTRNPGKRNEGTEGGG